MDFVNAPKIVIYSPLSRDGIKPFLLRWFCVVSLLVIGFAGIAVFSAAERVPPANIMFVEEVGAKMMYVAFACIYPWSLLVLMAELVVYLLISGGRSWGVCQIILAVCMGAAGAAFSHQMFSPFTDSVKATLVLAGGTMVGILASGLHFALYEICVTSLPNRDDFPLWWLICLILVGSMFVGALKQWTSFDPRFRQLIDYRDQRAAKKTWGDPSKLKPVPENTPSSDDLKSSRRG